MALGSTTYTSVVWTTGDVATEAKMDNMVANDQAYNSHAAQGMLLNNNTGYYQKDTGGSNREIINLDNSNILQFGASGITSLHFKYIWDGWQYPNETWTYASSTTFTISGDKTGNYQKGDKIRLKQGGSYKYFYITAVSYSAPNTTVTITGGTDYTLANATITDNYYSKAERPVGFPLIFNWTPTWTNLTVGNGVLGLGQFALVGGNQLEFSLKFTWGTTTSASGEIQFSVPIAISSSEPTSGVVHCGEARYEDSGTVHVYGVTEIVSTSNIKFLAQTASGTYVNLAVVTATIPFTWNTSDIISARGRYRI